MKKGDLIACDDRVDALEKAFRYMEQGINTAFDYTAGRIGLVVVSVEENKEEPDGKN